MPHVTPRVVLVAAALPAAAILLAAAGCLSSGIERYKDRPEYQYPDGRFYLKKCSGCHAPYPATRFSDREWPARVDAMRENVALTAEQRRRIVEFLQAHNGR